VLLRTALAAAPDYVEAHNNLGAPARPLRVPPAPAPARARCCLTAWARACTRLKRGPDTPHRPVTPRGARAGVLQRDVGAMQARARPPAACSPYNAERAGRRCPAPLLSRPAAPAERRGRLAR